MSAPFARRYAAGIVRWRWWIVLGSIALTALAALTASRLHVYSDFSYLLPQHARSVEDLRAIERRAHVIGTMIVAVEADDPARREQAARAMRDGIGALPPRLVSAVDFDRRAEHAFAWRHRWLFVPLAELSRVQGALQGALNAARLRANPLYVPLEDPIAEIRDALAGLDRRLARARAAHADAGERVSKDGRLQIMMVRTPFTTGQISRDRELLRELGRVRAHVAREVPGVAVGFAGDIVVALAEHDAILHGMLLAIALTVSLVLAALVWYFRSALAIGALGWSLTAGACVTFAIAKLALGYLDVATAFLSSIVIGNGINASILVTARYLEELRRGEAGVDALAGALQGALSGTLTAALTASVAYASLLLTVFRGFRHFGLIGGVGILLCWASAFTVLPAALAIARAHGMRPHREAPLGHWLARLLPRNLRLVAFITVAVTIAAAVITGVYVANDPFENNFRNLRSHGSSIRQEQRWMNAIDQAFGQGLDAAFVIAVPHQADVAPLVARLQRADAQAPPGRRLFKSIATLDDLLPDHQPDKLSILARIRRLLGEPATRLLDPALRERLEALRPPADLHALTYADVPESLAWPFTEANGTRGRLILVSPSQSYEAWNTRDIARFASRVRALVPERDVHLGGSWFVFADVIDAVLTDGPRATVASAVGAILIVLLVVGRGRHALITIACGLSGTVLMLAVCALLGLKVNFLDFVALPITIGIGIEYAANIVTRERQEGSVREALATTGGAVALCSYTTIVGYGSLLLSENEGIQSFGLAAMIGELMCLAVAVVLAPALLWYTHRPRS